MSSNDAHENIEVSKQNFGDSEVYNVTRSHLVAIIRARVEEILEILQEKMKVAGVANFSGNKIVITGGASQLSGMRELVGHVFSKNVRIGYPVSMQGLAESTSGIAFSVPIGMLMKISADEMKGRSENISSTRGKGVMGTVKTWFKENFG